MLLIQSPVLWEEVLCTAKVVDGYSGHRCSGCAQMHSSKLLLVNLLLHVVVDLLLILWSRKGLNLAHGS
jgi:hypothetical protein